MATAFASKATINNTDWVKVYTNPGRGGVLNLSIVNTGTKVGKVYVAVSTSTNPEVSSYIEYAAEVTPGVPLLRMGEPFIGGEHVYVKGVDDTPCAVRASGFTEE